jgi:hypothetical protein
MYNRRAVCFLAFCYTGLCIIPSTSALTQEAKIPFRLTIAAKEKYDIPTDAHFEGRSETERTKALPVIVTVAVGVVLISYLTDLVLDVYNRVTEGTLVIDLRDKQVTIHNLPGASSELIVVSDSGVQHFDHSEISRDVVKAFLDKVFGSKG